MSAYSLVAVAFLCGFVFDILWALCVNSVRDRHAARAAHLALLIYMLGLVSTLLVVERCAAAIVAYGLGNWLGTYLTVRYCKRQTTWSEETK
jgi:hypothetical protein